MENKTVRLAAIDQLYMLSEEERLTVKREAEQVAIQKLGRKPERQHFQNATISDYPAWLTRGIAIMLGIAFLGAFLTSAFSVFSAGRNHYLEAIPAGNGVGWQAVIVGLSVVLLAEFLTIASVLAARILLEGKRLWQLVMLIPTALGVVIAVTGNAIISQPVGFWPWLVTVAPPVSVVFLSLILEQLTLADIKRRHANERDYQQALQDWQYRSADPESLPTFKATYANKLRHAIRAVNSKGRGRAERVEIMQGLGREGWSILVKREMLADQWFMEDVPVNPTQPQPGIIQIPAHLNGNGTGKAAPVSGNNAPIVASDSGHG